MDRCRGDEEVEDERCIRRALQVLERRVRNSITLEDPEAAKDFLRIRLGRMDYEVFAVLWLDASFKLIEFAELFRGTVSQVPVYPRELAREAIRHNAFACILSHNHPSGCLRPSHNDTWLTHSMQSALATLDVRVLDHVIVSAAGTFSMAEHGLL
jgi:DNA repair protein RadC